MTCPACGAAVADGARFCAGCGHHLLRQPDERRVATVLFADLVGFTSLSETRDPEQVKNMVDRCFEHLVADIAAFGGRVDKIIGDAIVALFGAPLAHEDDAERAVRAALQMQRSIAERVHADVSGLRMRIGINTGEVLVGTLPLAAGGDYTAMGDVVNTASRLQTAAEPGQVLVGPATYGATRRSVRYTALGLIQARGREEPFEAWVAEEALLPPGARPDRGRVPLVGRDPEVGMLGHAVDAAVARRRALLMVVVGEAGMGKTRLAEEVATDAGCRHDAVVLEGRCLQYGEANVWWPVAEALRSGCGIDAADAGDVARDRCDQTVRTALGDSTGDAEIERVVNGLLHLMGYDGPLQEIDTTRAKEEVIRSLFNFVEAWSRRQPMIIVLSDIHWADEVVLSRIGDLLDRLASLQFVLIGTARHALLDRWTPQTGRFNTVLLNLDPLDRTDSADLLDALLESAVPDDLRALLLDRSGGNPFYLEELVSLLAEVGMVGDGRVAPGAELPDTLRGLVAARLDGLTVDERRTLDDAAVMGRRGTLEGLALMAEHAHGLGHASVAVNGLVAKDVLVVDEDKWSFRSDLVREVAYGMLTKGDRARRHAGIAKWMEAHHTGRPSDTDRIAHHYATAAALINDVGTVEHLPPGIEVKALEWLEKALAVAEAGEFYPVAVQLCTQALDIADAAPNDDEGYRLRFLLARARAACQLRELDRARADLDVAMVAAEAADDRSGRARVLLGRGDVEQKDSDFPASKATLEEAIDVFRSLGDEHGMADGLRALGMTLMFGDENEAAKAAYSDALDLYRSVGDRRGEAWSLQNLAWLAFSLGRADQADAWLQESAATFSAIGDNGGLGWALGLLAWVRFHQGRHDEAEQLATRMLSEARERGDRWAVGMMLVLLGALRLWSGRARQAIEPSQEACSLFRSMSDWYGHSQALAVLSRALLVTGQVEEAFAVVDEINLLGKGSSAELAGRMAHIFQDIVAAHAGLPDRVEHVLADPTDMAGPPSEMGFADQYVAMAMLHLQQGDAARAMRFLDNSAEHPDVISASRHAALALVRAATGDPDSAIALADEVIAASHATYADRIAALDAKGLALAQQADGAGASAAFAAARELAGGTDDRLAEALVELAEACALDALGDRRAHVADNDAVEALAAVGLADTAWRVAFTLATRPSTLVG